MIVHHWDWGTFLPGDLTQKWPRISDIIIQDIVSDPSNRPPGSCFVFSSLCQLTTSEKSSELYSENHFEETFPICMRCGNNFINAGEHSQNTIPVKRRLLCWSEFTGEASVTSVSMKPWLINCTLWAVAGRKVGDKLAETLILQYYCKITKNAEAAW